MKGIGIQICTVLAMTAVLACDDSSTSVVPTSNVEIRLSFANEPIRFDSIEVRLTDSDRTEYVELTDADGVAHFVIPAGFYDAQASASFEQQGTVYAVNGNVGSMNVTSSECSFDISMVQSTVNQIVIKELYIGGCAMDDGSGGFFYDKYVILYNNSSVDVNVYNLGLAVMLPYNANATNGFYTSSDELVYANESWLPLASIVWTMRNNIHIEPYSQIVIALNNALDCSATYSNSVDLSQADYVTYDNSVTTHVATHPTPSALIPTDHYFEGILVSAGTAWVISQFSPAFVVFRTDDTDLQTLIDDENNITYMGSQTQANRCFKLDRSMVVDAIEVYNTRYSSNRKRLTPDIDAGSVEMTSQLGHTLYRNVDVDQTLAIDGNEALLVYGYDADASGIDAEASAANGAKIVYTDTNNSSNDFYERERASIKD